MRSISSLLKNKVSVKGRFFSLSHISSLAHRGQDNTLILWEGSFFVFPQRKEERTKISGQRAKPTRSWLPKGQGWGAPEVEPTVDHSLFQHILDIPFLLSSVSHRPIRAHPRSWMGNSSQTWPINLLSSITWRHSRRLYSASGHVVIQSLTEDSALDVVRGAG